MKKKNNNISTRPPITKESITDGPQPYNLSKTQSIKLNIYKQNKTHKKIIQITNDAAQGQ